MRNSRHLTRSAWCPEQIPLRGNRQAACLSLSTGSIGPMHLPHIYTGRPLKRPLETTGAFFLPRRVFKTSGLIRGPKTPKAPDLSRASAVGGFLALQLAPPPRRPSSCAVLSQRQFTLMRLWPRCPATFIGIARRLHAHACDRPRAPLARVGAFFLPAQIFRKISLALCSVHAVPSAKYADDFPTHTAKKKPLHRAA
jgi:hypothetical protein